jgi:hypothetical protein
LADRAEIVAPMELQPVLGRGVGHAGLEEVLTADRRPITLDRTSFRAPATEVILAFESRKWRRDIRAAATQPPDTLSR